HERTVCGLFECLSTYSITSSVCRHVVGVPSAGQWTESALLSVFETIRPKSLENRPSLVRVASLDGVGATGATEPPRFLRRAFSVPPRFVCRARWGRGHLCRREGGQRHQGSELCTIGIAGSGRARISICCRT